MYNSVAACCLFLTVAAAVVLLVASDEECTDVGPFGIQYKNDGDNIKERLRGAKINFDKLANYNRTFLYMYYGRAPFFCKEILAPLSAVRVLKIYNFEINRVEPGVFHDLEHLDTIGIYQNNIRTIEKGVFNELNISRLVLDKNGIVNIERGAFDDMKNLRLISVEHNKIAAISPEWFNNCHNLHILYFDNNRITDVPMTAFKNMQTGANCNLSVVDNNCPQIWLQGNRIRNIHRNALTGLQKIQNVMFGDNDLTNVPNIFEDLKISVISLEYNELSCFSDEVVDSLITAETVYVGGNNLEPECLAKIETHPNTTSVIVYKLRLTDEDED